MVLNDFIEKLNSQAEQVEFSEAMAIISANYHYQPCAFTNGELMNEAGTNEGSCKIFAFAKLHELPEQETLACFGRYYREDVLQNPLGEDHKNIRNFIKLGWQGIKFEGIALS